MDLHTSYCRDHGVTKFLDLLCNNMKVVEDIILLEGKERNSEIGRLFMLSTILVFPSHHLLHTF